MNKIFFEKDGLTVTSAQHIKDMAGHFIDMANRELNSCKITIPNSLQSIYSKINSLGK